LDRRGFSEKYSGRRRFKKEQEIISFFFIFFKETS
jgi:hypothetical protein